MASTACSVDIDRPLHLVHQHWTSSASLPSFMGGTATGRQVDMAGVDWVTLVEGRSDHFGARVTEHVPERCIAWSNPEQQHSGVVRFEHLADDRALVTVEVEWQSARETAVGDQLIVRRQLQRDLEQFRQEAEGRAAPQPGGGDPVVRPHGALVAQAPGGDGRARPVGDGGRGRSAESPGDIPAKGWLDILKRTSVQLKQDNLSIVAAGVAFYVFLALVPALIAVISVYGLVADPADVERQLGSALSAMPAQAADLVREQLRTISEQDQAGVGLVLVVTVVVALLGASKGMQALVTALNIAYDEEETRTFFRLKGLVLLLTLSLAAAAVVGVGAMVAVGNIASGLGTVGELALTVLRWPLLAALVVLGLAVIYRYAPDRDAPAWRWVTPGAAVATVLWLTASIAFSIYVRNFGTYNETYGSLGAVVVLLLWLLLTAYALVLGAELDGEAERQTAKDTTQGQVQPLGRRGAYAADTVAGGGDPKSR